MPLDPARLSPWTVALAAAPDDPGLAAVCCDQLMEWGASLADVVEAYAGQPPGYEDGVTRAVLAEFGRRWNSGLGARWEAIREAKEDPNVCARAFMDDGEYADAVSAAAFDAIMYDRPIDLPDDNPAVAAAKQRAWEAARLDCKRRVLRLFPELEWVLTGYLDWDDPSWQSGLASSVVKGIRWDLAMHDTVSACTQPDQRRTLFVQTLKAEQLIPSGPRPRLDAQPGEMVSIPPHLEVVSLPP